MNIMTGNDRT